MASNNRSAVSILPYFPHAVIAAVQAPERHESNEVVDSRKLKKKHECTNIVITHQPHLLMVLYYSRPSSVKALFAAHLELNQHDGIGHTCCAQKISHE
jgi:hypothetical protein